MHTHTFSRAQEDRALEIMLGLMKNRRFFLYQNRESLPVHRLDPQVFGPAIHLDQSIRAAYANARRIAEQTITEYEKELGVTPPDLTNRQLVQCNCYNGGLEICEVFPLAAFTDFAPTSQAELRDQEVRRLAGNTHPDDYSPNDMKKLREQAEKNAALVWEELPALRDLEQSGACVFLLHTRFNPDRGYGTDFLEGRAADFKMFPYALGYLFYLHSQQKRIVQHSHVVFNTSTRSHVNVQHWNSGGLSLNFDASGGYSCQVYLPVVL